METLYRCVWGRWLSEPSLACAKPCSLETGFFYQPRGGPLLCQDLQIHVSLLVLGDGSALRPASIPGTVLSSSLTAAGVSESRRGESSRTPV